MSLKNVVGHFNIERDSIYNLTLYILLQKKM